MKAGAEVPTGAQDWRNKYYDSLDKLDSQAQQFKALEAVLKRVSGRLCIAALGQSPRLDDVLKQLQATMHRDANADELEKLAAALGDAIGALDRSNADEPAATSKSEQSTPDSRPVVETSHDPLPGEAGFRAILAAVLGELKRDPELTARVEALDATLASPLTPAAFSAALTSFTELVGQRIRHIELAKMEMEALVSQMVGKLDEIGASFAHQNENRSQSLASGETLNTRLAEEVKAMGESVESGDDLQQIRVQVRSRLDSIDRHLSEFRQREAALAREYRTRNEQMAARMAELEAEANRLQHELRDEQRTASLDMLTKVPNRKAYDKRIEDEIKRWQRFRQPTCVAAWDVDHFKRVNDAFGHRAGDGVLRAVAESLSGRIRATDFFARYGGEEFVMILTGTKLEDAVRVVDLMRIAISKLKMHYHGTPLNITISCGVTELRADDTAASVFERADKGLYQAKERGRNCCVDM